MPLPSWAGSTTVCTGTRAGAGDSRTKYSMRPTTSPPSPRASRRPAARSSRISMSLMGTPGAVRYVRWLLRSDRHRLRAALLVGARYRLRRVRSEGHDPVVAVHVHDPRLQDPRLGVGHLSVTDDDHQITGVHEMGGGPV